MGCQFQRPRGEAQVSIEENCRSRRLQRVFATTFNREAAKRGIEVQDVNVEVTGTSRHQVERTAWLAEREYCVCDKSLPDQRRICQIPLRESALESPRLFRRVRCESGGFLSRASVVLIPKMSGFCVVGGRVRPISPFNGTKPAFPKQDFLMVALACWQQSNSRFWISVTLHTQR